MSSYKVLGQLLHNSSNLTALYTVPASTQAFCSTLSACNQHSSVAAVLRVAVRPSGAAIDAKHYIVYDLTLATRDSLFLTIGISLNATDVVDVYSTTSSVSFSLFGSEV